MNHVHSFILLDHEESIDTQLVHEPTNYRFLSTIMVKKNPTNKITLL